MKYKLEDIMLELRNLGYRTDVRCLTINSKEVFTICLNGNKVGRTNNPAKYLSSALQNIKESMEE